MTNLSVLLDQEAEKSDEEMQVDVQDTKLGDPPSTLHSPKSGRNTPSIPPQEETNQMETDPILVSQQEPHTDERKELHTDERKEESQEPPGLQSLPVSPAQKPRMEPEGHETDEPAGKIEVGGIYGHRPVVEGRAQAKLRCKVIEMDPADEDMDIKIKYYQEHIEVTNIDSDGTTYFLKLYGGWAHSRQLLKWPEDDCDASPVKPKAPKKAKTQRKSTKKSKGKKTPRKKSKGKKTPARKKSKGKKTPARKRKKATKTPAKKRKNVEAQSGGSGFDFKRLGEGILAMLDQELQTFTKSHEKKMASLDARIKRCSKLVSKRQRRQEHGVS